MKKKYRIAEKSGEFTIQVLFHKGFGNEDWRSLDVYGGIAGRGRIPTPTKKYSSLKEAREVIQKFESPTIYHEP